MTFLGIPGIKVLQLFRFKRLISQRTGAGVVLDGSSPVQSIYKIYFRAGKILGNSKVKTVDYLKDGGNWRCIVHVTWPEHLTLEDVDSQKKAAHEKICRRLLQKLQLDRRVDQSDHPLINVQGNEPAIERNKQLVVIHMSKDGMNAIKQLWKKYNSEVKSIFEDAEKIDLIFDVREMEMFDRNVLGINKRRGWPAILDDSTLPIDNYREKIIATIKENRIVLIKGDTGCGKSVQVPQMILDDIIQNDDGSRSCNVLLVQPRRITTESLAVRIADRRQEFVGNTVGYQVRMKSVLPKYASSILCLTQGILIKRIMSDRALTGITHIIFDEVHERSQELDLLLLLIKDVMRLNENLRVILMSATINTDIFARYFPSLQLISILGRSFDVKVVYDNPIYKNLDRPAIKYNDLAEIIRKICAKEEPGTVLCFLPRIIDISTMKSILEEEETDDNKTLEINVCHSKVPYQVQHRVFVPAPAGIRKVVLCTNICEVGITVPDVTVVIDTGVENILTFNKRTGYNSYRLSYISKAAAEQRKGRAGRMSDGTCYRLYTEEMYRQFDDYKVCGVNTEPMENLILYIKALYPETSVDEIASQLIQPPSQLSVKMFVNKLKQANILDENEDLTLLGKRINPVPANIEFVQLLLYAAFYRCLNPFLVMVPMNSESMGILYHDDNGNRNRLYREIKSKYNDFSDHIAAYKIYDDWEQHGDNMPSDVKSSFNIQAANLIKGLKQYYENWLTNINMIEYDDIGGKYDETMDEQLISGILCANFPFILKDEPRQMKNKVIRSIRDQYGQKISINSKSVNSKSKSNINSNETFIYVTAMEFVNEQNFALVHDITKIHPLTVALFYAGDLKIEEDDSVIAILPDTRCCIRIHSDKESVETILQLREMMNRSFRYFLRVGKNTADLDDFFEQLRNTVISVLPKQIDETT